MINNISDVRDWNKFWNIYINDIYQYILTQCIMSPGGSGSKASACSAGDPSSSPGLGRSPGEANGNPLQYSCLENSTDWGAW